MTTHGTNAAYNKGCHCTECRAAHAAYTKHRRETAATAAERTDHGTNNCYNKGGCRCQPCKTAHAEAAAYTRERARAQEAEERARSRAEFLQAREDKARRDFLARFPDEFIVVVPLPTAMSWPRACRYARNTVLTLPEAKDLTFATDWDWKLTRRPDGTRYVTGRVAASTTRPAAESAAAALAAADVFADHVPGIANAIRAQLDPTVRSAAA